LIRKKLKFEPLVFPAFVASLEDDGRLNETTRQGPRNIRQFIATSASGFAPLCALFAPGDNN
jgi:hypothetical protein